MTPAVIIALGFFFLYAIIFYREYKRSPNEFFHYYPKWMFGLFIFMFVVSLTGLVMQNKMEYQPEYPMKYSTYADLKDTYLKNWHNLYKEIRDRSFSTTIESRNGEEYIVKNKNDELSIENERIGNVLLTKTNFRFRLMLYQVDPILLYSKVVME